MPPSIDRRAVIIGGVAAGAGLVITTIVHSSDRATAQRVAARDEAARIYGPPAIVARSSWGADESLRTDPATYQSRVEKIVVHHTGTRNDSPDWAHDIRQIYAYETSSGYRDLPYHFLVDPNGVIYEGRWARAYPAGTVPDGESRAANQVQGGHTKGHNKRTIGLALLGDFTQAAPTPAAVDALVALLVWKCARWDLDPLGSSQYRLDDGSHEELPNIFGHGFVRETECPGAAFETLMPAICERTAAHLA